MTTKREKQAEFQKQYDALGFNDYLLGDEVIVTQNPQSKIEVRYRQQINREESRVFTMIFDNQTQVERLFRPIMKGLRDDHRR